MPILGVIASAISGSLSTTAYESIATQTIGSGGSASSITFSSIPSTYKHLQVRGLFRSDKSADTNADLYLYINGDTSNTLYTRHYLRGNGTSPSSLGFAAPAFPVAGEAPAASSPTGAYGGTIIDILDYTNVNKNTIVRTFHGDEQGTGTTQNNVYLTSSLWMNTNAVTSLTFTLQASTNFIQHSQFALYGIKG